MEGGKNSIVVSVVSTREVTIKAQTGKLQIPNPPKWLEAGIKSLDVTVAAGAPRPCLFR